MASTNTEKTLFLSVLAWLRYSDGNPIDKNDKYAYGLTVKEIANNTGWETSQVRDEIKRIQCTFIGQYVLIRISYIMN